jgi:hypothetical protein
VSAQCQNATMFIQRRMLHSTHTNTHVLMAHSSAECSVQLQQEHMQHKRRITAATANANMLVGAAAIRKR